MIKRIRAWSAACLLLLAGTPRAQIVELNAEIIKIMASADMRAYMTSQRLQVYPPHSADDFGRQIRNELEIWREVARAAKVEAQ